MAPDRAADAAPTGASPGPNPSGGDRPERIGLLREMGFVSAFCLVVGAVIGSGVFLVASDIAKSVASPWLALSVWVVAGAVSLAGGLVFAELGAMYPRAGGPCVYLREAFHPIFGFLYGWTMFSVIQTGSIAAVAVAFAKATSRLVPLSDAQTTIVAIGSVAALTVANAFGVRRAAGLNNVLSAFKILALLAIVGLGVALPALQPLSGSGVFRGASFSAYGVALIAAFWAYDGWAYLAFAAGEVKEPQKNIPRALGAGLLTVIALYLGANWVYYRMLTPAAISGSSLVAADATLAMLGPAALVLMAAVVMTSTLGCNNSTVLAGARIVYSLSRSGTFFARFGRVHEKYRTPNAALGLQMVWASVLVVSGTFDQLFTYVVFGSFVFYGLSAVAVMRLRRIRADAPRPYRVPLYPWLPVAYILFVAAFSANAVWEKPVEALIGLGIIGLGVPLYFWFRRRGPAPDTTDEEADAVPADDASARCERAG